MKNFPSMIEDELLNFNYPIQPQEQIELENQIKREIREFSLNISFKNEIERYSDKYILTATKNEIQKTINIEIMSSELKKMRGLHSIADGNNIIVNDLDEDDNLNENINEESSERNSLDGGDDYEQNYYEDDDLVEENNNNNEEIL